MFTTNLPETFENVIAPDEITERIDVPDQNVLVGDVHCNTEQADCLGWSESEQGAGSVRYRGFYQGQNDHIFQYTVTRTNQLVLSKNQWPELVMLGLLTSLMGAASGLLLSVVLGLFAIAPLAMAELITKATADVLLGYTALTFSTVGFVTPTLCTGGRWFYYSVIKNDPPIQTERSVERPDLAEVIADPDSQVERLVAEQVEASRPVYTGQDRRVIELASGAYLYEGEETVTTCDDREDLRETLQDDNATELFAMLFEDEYTPA